MKFNKINLKEIIILVTSHILVNCSAHFGMTEVSLNVLQDWAQNCTLFEPVELQTSTEFMDLKCGVLCTSKAFCYYSTKSNDKCLLCARDSNQTDNDDSLRRADITSLLGETLVYYTQVYYKELLRKIYEIVTVKKSQADAKAACRSMNKELLSLGSVEEYQTVKLMLQEHNADFWLSLNKNLDNIWKYDDGSPDIREIWQSSQPDGNGNCSCFKYSYSYQLDDQTCSNIKYYVCESYMSYGL